MKCSRAKASFVTARLFSSSLTMPRQASDDSTSVDKKCLRANVLLPDPLGPIRTTRDRLGTEIVIVVAVSLSTIEQGSPSLRKPGISSVVHSRAGLQYRG
jgi:hypothetical protein